MSRRSGFTLLEILLAIVIGLLLLGIAVPSVSGMLREQRLKETMTQFDDFVRKAQSRAVKEQRTIVLVWDEKGISAVDLGDSAAHSTPSGNADEESPGRFEFPLDTEWTLHRPAALVKKPVWEWPFWKSGTCEPVVVEFKNAAGAWTLEYSGLTARGKILAMDVK